MLGGIWGCILFESKEYIPRPPKKDSRGDFGISPRDPLKTTKGRACGPFLWISSRGGTGGCFYSIFGRTVGGGLCPAPGQGLCVGGRVDASLRTGAWNGNPINHRSEICDTPCSSFRATRFAGAGGVGAGERYEGTDSHVASLLGMTGRHDFFSYFLSLRGGPQGRRGNSFFLLAVWVWEACPGSHIGPPLRGYWKGQQIRESGRGRSPAPTGRPKVLPMGASAPAEGERFGHRGACWQSLSHGRRP